MVVDVRTLQMLRVARKMKPRTDGFVSAYNFPCVPSAALDRRGSLCLRREVANGPTKRNAARHGATRRVIERPPHRPIRAPHDSSPYINEPRSDRLNPKLLRSEIDSFFSRRSSSDSIVPRMADPVTESPQIVSALYDFSLGVDFDFSCGFSFCL